jgi:hypothetical protein
MPVIAVADALSCRESDIQNDHYRKALLRGQASDIGSAISLQSRMVVMCYLGVIGTCKGLHALERTTVDISRSITMGIG